MNVLFRITIIFLSKEIHHSLCDTTSKAATKASGSTPPLFAVERNYERIKFDFADWGYSYSKPNPRCLHSQSTCMKIFKPQTICAYGFKNTTDVKTFYHICDMMFENCVMDNNEEYPLWIHWKSGICQTTPLK